MIPKPLLIVVPSPPSSTWRRSTSVIASLAIVSVIGTGTFVSAFNHGALVTPTRTTPSLAIPYARTRNTSFDQSSCAKNNIISLPTRVTESYLYASANDDSSEGNAQGRKVRFPVKSKFKPAAIAAMSLIGVFAFTPSAAIAFGAKKATSAAATSAAVSSALVLPSIPTLVIACLLPTLLGYYKSEYGVSYGYGTAMAASSYLILNSIATSAGMPLLPCLLESASFTSLKPAAIIQSLTAMLSTLTAALGPAFQNLKALLPTSLPAFHAFALLFYGTRLDLFLLYREICLPRFRAMRERIEDRAKKQGSRLKRTPFLISCAFLYFCMMCPLLITSKVCEGVGMSFGAAGAGGLVGSLENMLRISVITAISGFLLGAIGDLNKSVGKAIQGEDELITWGVFRFFRHPNYTGEVIGWVSSCLAGFLAVAWKAAGSAGGLALWKSNAPYLALSVMGAMGISFVLGTATAGLEFRQREKYGEMEDYREWVKKSWAGLEMGQRKEQSDDGGANGGDKAEA